MADSKKKPTRTGGDSVGRDRIVSAGDRSVAVGGDVKNSNIITGDYNRVERISKFSPIFAQLNDRNDMSNTDKTDLKTELETFEAEDKKGPEANQGFLAQHLRSFKRIAPDMIDVAIATIANPAAGFGMIAKKVAEKMKAETK